MKQDPGSNYAITEGLTAISRTVDTYYSTAINHATTGESAEMFLSCGLWAGSLLATVQWCVTDSATPGDWTDQTDDGSGNAVSATLSAAGSAELSVPNPLAQFSRLKVAIGDTCVFSVTNIAGPLLSVDPAATS